MSENDIPEDLRLKPCPFCGGIAVFTIPRGSLWMALCLTKNCITSPQFPTKEQAADWWNRRPEKESKESKDGK